MTRAPASSTSSLLGAKTPHRIVVGAWPSSGRFSAVQRLLSAVRPARSGSTVRGVPNAFSERLTYPSDPSDAEALREALRNDPDSTLLLFIDRPEAALALALEIGESPAVAAEAWQIVSERLLGIAESEPNSIVIVPDDALNAPGEFATFLSERLRWPLAAPDASTCQATMTSRWEDLFLLAANQYVRDRQELSRLAEELEERRDLRPSINIRRIDSLSVINDVRELRQENTALLDLLHKLQMELEHSAQSLGQREDELRAAAQEASKMKGHIHRLTGELDKRDLELQRASRSLAAIETSTSWRLTAPMRRLVSTIKGRSAR